jgi:hypothetical protein
MSFRKKYLSGNDDLLRRLQEFLLSAEKLGVHSANRMRAAGFEYTAMEMQLVAENVDLKYTTGH